MLAVLRYLGVEEARAFEHSGPYLALLKWGSELKQLILFTILANVFLAPWGLASTQRAGAVGLAIVALLAKACAVGCVVAVIDNSFAKLRLFKITEFVSGAFLLAVLGVFTLYLGVADGPGPGAWRLQGVANVIAAVMLLIEFGMLRQALARDQIRLYMAQSALISVLAIVIAADRNLPDLYALAALSAALKVVAVPLVLRRLLGRPTGNGASGEEEPGGVAGSQTLSPASAVLAAAGPPGPGLEVGDGRRGGGRLLYRVRLRQPYPPGAGRRPAHPGRAARGHDGGERPRSACSPAGWTPTCSTCSSP